MRLSKFNFGKWEKNVITSSLREDGEPEYGDADEEVEEVEDGEGDEEAGEGEVPVDLQGGQFNRIFWQTFQVSFQNGVTQLNSSVGHLEAFSVEFHMDIPECYAIIHPIFHFTFNIFRIFWPAGGPIK